MEDQVVGRVIDGYRITDILGRGGMGTVYRAEDVNLSRPVALKRINPGQQHREMFMHRFRSEAKALARIDSSYIVSVYALRETDIGLLIVMEFVDGGTLKDKMNEHGVMAPDVALPYLKQMLQAFGDAHRAGVIHRDIKPQNILLSSNGTIKITDFGIAKLRTPDSGETVTQGGQGGTLKYMSPEQVSSIDEVDDRSDLYSLGMTAYEMMAGCLPFESTETDFDIMRKVVEGKIPPPTEYNESLPQSLVDWIQKATAKNQDDRYQSADEMLAALEAIEDEVQDASELWDDDDTATVFDPTPPGASADDTGTVLADDDATYVPDPSSGDGTADAGMDDATVMASDSGASGASSGGASEGAADEAAQTASETKKTVASGETALSASAQSSADARTDDRPAQTSEDDASGLSGAAIGGAALAVLLIAGAAFWFLTQGGGSGGDATLAAASDPAQATVYVDGDSVGRTPLAGVALPAGAIPIRIVKSGYQPAETTLTVQSGDRVRLDGLSLAPKPARITVTSSPADAQVLADGAVLGTTPLEDVALAQMGDVQFELRKDGYQTVAQTFEIEPGTPMTWTVGALRPTSTASASQPSRTTQPAQPDPEPEPTTASSSDGAPMGTVALTGMTNGAVLQVAGKTMRAVESVQIPAGTHTATCSHSDYPDAGPIETTITVEAGASQTLGCYFEQTVNVSAPNAWGNVWIDGTNTGERTPHKFTLGPGTYELSLPIPRSETLTATGGKYQRRSEAGETTRSTFNGEVVSVTIRPSFAQTRHAIVFDVTEQ